MLRAIYESGSSVFLSNSRDVDFVHFYDTKEECRSALIMHQKKKGIDVHFETKPRVYLCCYIYHFMKLIDGEDLHLEQFSIFDHKEEYVKVLEKFTKFLPKTNKKWYHILTACYMLNNNSYDLTKSQLDAVQRTHDKGITDAKYDFCIQFITNFLQSCDKIAKNVE